MNTFLIIIGFFILIFLTNMILRFLNPKKINEVNYDYEKRIKPKTSIVLFVGIISMIGTLFYYYANKKEDPKINESEISIEKVNPCPISEDFIKMDLANPETAEFSLFDCSQEFDNINTYTVLRKVNASNALGVKKAYVYKLQLKYLGGIAYEKSNWILLSIQSEEYRK